MTHLDALLAAVAKAAPSWPTPRKPWREMLPEELDWLAIERPSFTGAPGRKGRYITLGMLDDPAAQAQYPAVFDLEDTGGLLIGGSGGAGKTTALRTAAMAAVAGATPDEVTLFVIDAVSRSLVTLGALPHVAAVATGDDLESMTRVVKLLGAELDRRRPLLAALDVQAENLSAYLDKGRALPRIVVLIDGFQNLSALLGNVRPMEFGPLDWFGELQRIITDGRQLGIHAILTTDRRAAVPALVMSALGARLVLRQTDEAGYGEYSIPSGMSRGIELPNGRGIWDGQLVQIGVVGTEAKAAAQGAAIADLRRLAGGRSSQRAVIDGAARSRAGPARRRRPRAVHPGAHRRLRRGGRGQCRAHRALRRRSGTIGTFHRAHPRRPLPRGCRPRGLDRRAR